MKILYFVRLFSGLEKGLQNRKWEPRGVPTISQMIEVLDRGPDDLELIFACKDYGSDWAETADVSFPVKGLNGPVTVLAGEKYFSSIWGRLRSRLSTVRQTLRLMQAVKRFKPDVIYIDRGNLWPAAFMARMFKTPVVWRLMGVLPQMHRALDGSDWRSYLSRWAFRSPFAAVICTLDGSGGAGWMERALSVKSQRYVLLNGVNKRVSANEEQLSIDIPNNKVVVLFVGRMEDNKGCVEFLEAFKLAKNEATSNLHAVLVGDGSLLEKLKLIANEMGIEEGVTFTGSIAPQQVAQWQKRADIYVSLNSVGSLSNANLEAICGGTCMIIPESDNPSGKDAETDKMIPADVAYRFGRIDQTDKLKNAIIYLADNKNERMARAHKTAMLSETVLKTWDERIQFELSILRDIAQTA